jgi:uncharacterized damage-inducible protein DinB
MSEPVLTAQEVLKWYESTSDQWRKFLGEHPEILALPCDIAGSKTVAEIMHHIVAVELRYAQRMDRMPETDFSEVGFDSVEMLFATHDRATAIYKRLLASDLDWEEKIEYKTRTWGPARSSMKTTLFHVLLHSIRHYAQLGTLVRQCGFAPGWPGDYLVMGVELI